ncbi:hypothetical protein DV515_00008819 [Chloebia gouldiae]|uniref:Uncharacterized protein n=1 Tax=Chloebia gouldiae TaxID=44316 RepID=A0A3L8SEJ6_CHLGU|nr:hypothetical protein DV515_00008819 [Chloebia gouldiae]
MWDGCLQGGVKWLFPAQPWIYQQVPASSWELWQQQTSEHQTTSETWGILTPEKQLQHRLSCRCGVEQDNTDPGQQPLRIQSHSPWGKREEQDQGSELEAAKKIQVICRVHSNEARLIGKSICSLGDGNQGQSWSDDGWTGLQGQGRSKGSSQASVKKCINLGEIMLVVTAGQFLSSPIKSVPTLYEQKPFTSESCERRIPPLMPIPQSPVRDAHSSTDAHSPVPH